MTELVAAVRKGLAELADPTKAVDMQTYMKSAMPFRGVPAPPRRALFRELFAAHPLPDRDAWQRAVRTLWHEAEYREERYAAIELTGHRAYGAFQDLDTLPLYEELIIDGAWWDYVDELAIRRVGPIVAAHPVEGNVLMRRWSVDADMWHRRTSIICQVGAKADIDLDLLTDCVLPNMADREFFIRKAIGWALRAHAWLDPVWVSRFVAAHDDELSPLSKREALKNVR